jgi:hypothetical protein
LSVFRVRFLRPSKGDLHKAPGLNAYNKHEIDNEKVYACLSFYQCFSVEVMT